MENLKYKGYAIACQEVPDEISLAINISGCPYKCRGCHSQYLWDYGGNDLLCDLKYLLNKHEGYISCVCFMGGDQNIKELKTACDIVKAKGLKTCIYSGSDSLDLFAGLIGGGCVDYIKIGRYSEECGGLESESTNQKMYKVTTRGLEDITERFHKYGENKKDFVGFKAADIHLA